MLWLYYHKIHIWYKFDKNINILPLFRFNWFLSNQNKMATENGKSKVQYYYIKALINKGIFMVIYSWIFNRIVFDKL